MADDFVWAKMKEAPSKREKVFQGRTTCLAGSIHFSGKWGGGDGVSENLIRTSNFTVRDDCDGGVVIVFGEIHLHFVDD